MRLAHKDYKQTGIAFGHNDFFACIPGIRRAARTARRRSRTASTGRRTRERARARGSPGCGRRCRPRWRHRAAGALPAGQGSPDRGAHRFTTSRGGEGWDERRLAVPVLPEQGGDPVPPADRRVAPHDGAAVRHPSPPSPSSSRSARAPRTRSRPMPTRWRTCCARGWKSWARVSGPGSAPDIRRAWAPARRRRQAGARARAPTRATSRRESG